MPPLSRWVDALADASYDSHSLAFFLSGASENDDDIYVMINSYWQKLAFKIQEMPGEWARVVDTSLPSADDVVDVATPLQSASYVVDERSIVILVRPKS